MSATKLSVHALGRVSARVATGSPTFPFLQLFGVSLAGFATESSIVVAGGAIVIITAVINRHTAWDQCVEAHRHETQMELDSLRRARLEADADRMD